MQQFLVRFLVILFSAVIVVLFSVGLNPNDILGNPTAIEVVEEAIANYKKTNEENEKCAEQIGWFVENLEESCIDDWAIQMIDACAKMPSGQSAQQNLLGECLSIESVDAAIKGQYCLISPTFDGNWSFSTFQNPYALKSIWYQLIRDNEGHSRHCMIPNFGICIPDQCNEEDVVLLFETVHTTAKCQIDQEEPIDLGELITIGYFALFIMLMFTSTIYDVLTKNGEPHPLLLVFSIRTNCKKLFSTKKTPHHFQCLYGLKVISMIWMLAGYIVMMKFMFNPFSNSVDTEQYDHTLESIVFISVLNSVDTFLVITGCIITYNYLRMVQIENWRDFYYTHKFNRLMFTIIIPMLLSIIFLTKCVTDGPLKSVIDRILEEPCTPCRKYWWSTLWFIIEEASNYEIIFSFVESVLITLIVSLFWVLAFESPIARLEEYFLEDEDFYDENEIDENNNSVS